MGPVRSCFFPRRRLSVARPRFRRALVASLAAAATLAAAARADAAPLVIDGDVPGDGLDHFFIDFDVPAGIKEIEVRHDDLSEANILDWGLYDQDGYRGWGGGTSEPAIVGEAAASRAYVPGPIKPGKWRIVVGKAKVVASPAKYHVEIDLRTAPTLTPLPRTKYVAAAPRKTETRYYAGDFHVHSRESTDASTTLQHAVLVAKSRGLDFIELSDHNTVTQLDFYEALQASEPSFLILPGIEYTTYAGHANAIGATRWVDHKIGQPGVTIGGAVDQILAQGALFSVNHPVLDLADLCIGCAWKHEVDPAKISGVEICTTPLSRGGQLFAERAIAYWDALLDKGFKIAPLGGSDEHRAGVMDGTMVGMIGGPTTLVRARELSVAGILEGVKKAATVVKLDGPEDAMVELEAASSRGGDAVAFPGDTVNARAVFLRARVTGGVGQSLRFLENGKPVGEPVEITSDPFVRETLVTAREGADVRWRAEALVEGKPRTVTSHIWLHLDPSGPLASEPPPDEGGCSVPAGRPAAPVVLVPLAIAVVALIRRRR